jgi:hypothetical protein
MTGWTAKEIKTVYPKAYAEILAIGIEQGKKAAGVTTTPAPSAADLQAEYSRGYEAGKLAGASDERTKHEKETILQSGGPLAALLQKTMAENPGMTSGQAAVKIIDDFIGQAERDQRIIKAAADTVNAPREPGQHTGFSPMHAADPCDQEVIGKAAEAVNAQRESGRTPKDPKGDSEGGIVEEAVATVNGQR